MTPSGNLTEAVVELACNMQEASRFSTLFKKYRLKAEFSTLSQLGLALAEKGFIYEDSIFSHWQSGTRVPQNRIVLLKLLEIFAEKKAITILGEANEFLSLAGEGYLSEEELQRIPIKLRSPIFQVPNEIINFSGRQDIINRFVHKEDITGKVVLIHGAAGIGKTALAIKLGHLLKDKFKDGVLWYKVEEDNIMDILLSIARVFGEDISNISDLQVRTTVVRSLLASKNILLFLDSGELYDDIHLLIPNSQFCTTIITSQKNYLKTPIRYIDIKVNPFTDKEVLYLFKEVLQEKFSRHNTGVILKLARKVGYLPLALHIIARQLLSAKIPIDQIPSLASQDDSLFQNMEYEDKNLYAAIAVSYEKLDSKMRSVLVSASIFKGKDFSVDSIGYINGLSKPSTIKILQNLVDLSLLEHSTKNRYRIHPAIREFVRHKLDYPRSSYLILIALFIFIFFSFWWVLLQLFIDKNNFMYLIFSATYGLVALYGGICGIHTARKWGGFKTQMGKAVYAFSFGLFAQVFGQIVYSYYALFQHIPAPYPSIGDIGFSGTIPFYIWGALLLAESSGIKISIRSFRKKIMALIVPIIMLTTTYILFLQDYKFDWSNLIKTFIDFGNPLGETVYISIAIIIFIFSRNILDGIMRSKASLLLLALVAQFLADSIFLYKPDAFYPGNYMDLIYLASYFIMTLALLNLRSLQVKIKNI